MTAPTPAMRSSSRPNVVCIVLDTLRYDVVHHTCPFADVQVPHLDALRADSVDFQAAFGEGEPTIPVRRALWTGIRSFPWRYDLDVSGVWPGLPGWHQIPPGQATLAELLFAAGFRTALVSDVYHMFKPNMNFTRGWLSWDFVRGQETDNWRSGPISAVLEEARRYVKREVDPARDAALIQYLLNKRSFAAEDPLPSGSVFRRAIDWLDTNHDLGPFLLWLEAFDPHEPWDPPREYADRYCPDFDGTEFIYPPEVAVLGNEREHERARALYFGEVTYIDEWIGRFLNRLDELGRLDDTIIVFLSDHGTELLDHDRFGKSAPGLHAFNTQLNWMIRHPDLSAGTVTELVGNHDVFPTLLNLTGVDLPELRPADEALSGQSTVPLLQAVSAGDEGADRLWDREYAITGWADHAAVRSRDWNYVVNFEQPDDRPRLFDLRADPAERHNVLTDQPEVAAHLRKELEGFLGQDLPAALPDRRGQSPAPCHEFYRERTRE